MKHQLLTQAQLGIWMGHQQARDPAIYNCGEAIRLRGPLSHSRFAEALAATLDRTEALRICFIEKAGEPSVVAGGANFGHLQFVDLSAEQDPEQKLQTLQRQLLATPLRIELGELCKHRLFRLCESTHVWVHVAHHIALDGYAFQIFSRAVADHYRTGVAGRAFGSLADLRAEDLRYQGSETRVVDAQFWRGGRGAAQSAARLVQYRPPTSVTEPLLRLSPAAARRVQLKLKEETFSLLREVAGKQKLSWVNLLVALLAGFVADKSGRTKFALGLPVMLRMKSAASYVPAMVMNINRLPVTVELSDTPMDTARKLAVRLAVQSAHQGYRYEHLRESGDPETSFGPVVNVMPFGPLSRFGDCSAAASNLSAGPVEDISIACYPDGASLCIDLDVHPKRYDLSAASALAGDLRTALESSLPQHDSSWATIESTVGSQPTVPPSPVQALVEQARAQPWRLALQCEERSWTYAQLVTEAREFSYWLNRQGLEPGDLVAFDLPRCAELIPLVLGVLWSGCGYLVLSPEQPKVRRELMLKQARPALVLSELPQYSRAGVAEIRAPRAGDPAYIVFTSGSSGQPKGVEVSHGALAHFLHAAQLKYQFRSTDRVLQFASLSFDASVEELFVTLSCGACLVYREDYMLDSIASFLSVCRRQQLTVLDLPTAFWNEWVWAIGQNKLTLPAEIRQVIIGGEVAEAARVNCFCAHAPAVKLLNTYGPSEATVVATVADLQREQPLSVANAVSIGSALGGTRAELVDTAGRLIRSVEQSGELILSGPCLASGYLGLEALTAERFRFFCLDEGQPAVRCYCTGDRARRRADGSLVFLGRLDDEIKLSGHRVCPAEVEAAFTGHRAVRACAVLVDQTSGEPQLVAFVEADPTTSIRSLLAYAGQQLPAAMLPSRLHLLNRLARNSNGKLDRRRLQEQLSEAANQQREVSLETTENFSSAQQHVLSAWQQVLGGAAPSLDLNFFEAGGSSLQVIALVNRLSGQGSTLTVADVFSNPTPRALAKISESLLVGTRPERAVLGSRPWQELLAVPTRWFARLSGQPRPQLRHFVLTGATGFVGTHLLASLEARPDIVVTCLVRAQSEEAGRNRLRRSLSRHGLASEELVARVRIVPVDLERQGLDFFLLSRVKRCDVVLHCAAKVSLTRDFSSLKKSNVETTRHLIHFAARRGAALHYVSTLAVVPRQLQPVEEKFFVAHAGLQDGYQQSKWAGEALCEQAAELGLCVHVYRLGRVSGARLRPEVNPQDLIWRIGRASVRAQAWPTLDIAEPWLPVDDAASLIVHLSTTVSRPGARIYNLAHNGEVQLDRVYQGLVGAGYCLARLPLPEWLRTVAEQADAEDQATLAFFELNQQRQESIGPMGTIASEHVRSDAQQIAIKVVGEQLIAQYCQSARQMWERQARA